MKKNAILLLLLFFSFCSAFSQSAFNGSFELVAAGKPVGWLLKYAPSQELGYLTNLDSMIKRTGKYAMSIEKLNDKATYAAIGFTTARSFEGKTVELKGYIKTRDVSAGHAGLWMRVEGYTGNLLAEFMEKDGPKGTTEWKQYSIKYNYKKDEVSAISVGGIVTGNGKAWFDDLELLIDGKPIDKAKVFAETSPQSDTTFTKRSKIAITAVDGQQQNNLAFLGQFWGFLKYHHPAVAKGSYHWDFELFRLLPQVIAAKDNQQLSTILESYIDGLPKPAICKSCDKKPNDSIAFEPDYGHLFDGKVISSSLTQKLSFIKENRHQGESFYVGRAGAGNPAFKNERNYADMPYPDAGYRLLSLFRYWAMINYFFPYRDQIEQDWNQVLTDFVPVLVSAKSEKEYVLAMTRLIAKVGDTHANLWGGARALSTLKGKFGSPFQARFIEGKLVVTGYFTDTLKIKEKVKVGDLVLAINGQDVDELVKAYLPLTAASNYSAQLRDLPHNFLLRSNEPSMNLKVQGSTGTTEVVVGLVDPNLAYKNIDHTRPIGYELIDGDIGYVYPAKYKNTDLPAIKKLFANAAGMVIDMRCYPSDFMPFTFGGYLKDKASPFAKFTQVDLGRPGLFSYMAKVSNGGGGGFKGKVMVIVNASSQSNAEYTTMAFQSAPNVRVLGSTTAGADGNVSGISLPGGLSTMISGIGVFYPDGTRTQKLGVKIDYPLTPTINGIREGKDELLERAIELLRKGW